MAVVNLARGLLGPCGVGALVVVVAGGLARRQVRWWWRGWLLLPGGSGGGFACNGFGEVRCCWLLPHYSNHSKS
eukprot:COSAG05_NODE_881_length_6789_cov_21.387743_11_plen_74_part_00